MPETKTISAPVINLKDESYDPKKSDTHHLAIFSSDTNWAFAVLDTNTNKYLVLNCQQTTFPKFETLEKLKGNFKSVTCAVGHNKFTLVPSVLFNEENKASLLGFNHPVDSEEKIYSDTLHNMEAKNIFTISKSFESLIRKHFVNAHFVHNSTSFIDGLLVQNKNNSGKNAFANFHSSYFEIVILDNGKLLFSNAFPYKAPEDIAYYILFVYEQLHLNPEEIELVLSGEIEKNAKEHGLLYHYIRHVRFASLPDGFTYSYKFNEIPSHKFWSLFTQYLVTN